MNIVFYACCHATICSIFVAIMFVQATKSRRQNKTYVSYLVRESFRTSQGPRSRTVSNIWALPPECAAPRFFVGTGEVQRRIISCELTRGGRRSLINGQL